MKNIIIHTYKEINKLLEPEDRKKQKWIMFLLFVNSIFDIIGLSTLFPLISIAFSENKFENYFYKLFNSMYGIEGMPQFLVVLGIHIAIIIIIKNIISLWISHKIGKYCYTLGKNFSLKAMRAKYQLDFLKLFSDNSHKHVWEVNALPVFFVNFTMLNLYKFFNEVIIVAIIFIALMLKDPISLVLIGLSIVPAALLFYRLVKNKIQQYEEEKADLAPEINSTIQQMIFGFTDVQITGTEKSFMGRYDRYSERMKDINTNLYTFGLAPQKVIETSIILGVLALIAYGILFIEDNAQFQSLLTIYAVAAFRLAPSGNRMILAIMGLKKYSYSIDRMKLIFNRDNLGDTLPTKNAPLSFKEHVKLEGLTFSYDEENEKVLNNIDLTIHKGKSLGIVGKSGSGKSTLMKVILGFLEPQEGRIAVDGESLTQENMDTWRKIIGYVSQDFFILEGTIRENVAFGIEEKDIDDKLIEECIETASLKEFVDALPEGVNTPIGERGSQISGGQKQRIAIARALYSGASILFFDEATSALDADTEKEITESIRKIGDGFEITTVIIAHNRQTLKYCDQIIEMEDGKITNAQLEI